MRYQALAWLGVIVAGAGCSSPEGNPIEPFPPPQASPPVLAIVAGDGQEGVLWQPTPFLFTVRLTAGGQPVPFQVVKWTVEEGSGGFNPVTGATGTDVNGVASVGFRPTSRGTVRVRAKVSGVEPVRFTALLRAPEVAVVSGNEQEAATGDPLLQPLVVRVTDDRGNPLPGARVIWRITEGAGEFGGATWFPDSMASVAGGGGLASMTLHPYSPGIVTVEARVINVDHPAAVFTVHTSGPYTALIRYGPLFDCGELSAIVLLPTAPIRVGDRVTFENTWCPGRVRAVSVPPGAASFASDPLPAGGRFSIIVTVPGLYVAEDAINLGWINFSVHAP